MTPRPSFCIAMIATAFVAGCSTHPQLDTVISDEVWKADYPALLPAEDLHAAAAARMPREGATTLVASADTPVPEIDARAARLKARAAGLRGEVIDAASKDRLNEDIELEEEDV